MRDSVLESHIPSLWASFVRIAFPSLFLKYKLQTVLIMVTGGVGGKGGWISWETGIDIYMLLYIK